MSKLNRRTVGKIRAAYPESEAIAKLATQVVRLERVVREAEDIGNTACREAEAEHDRTLSDLAEQLEGRFAEGADGVRLGLAREGPEPLRGYTRDADNYARGAADAFREAASLIRGRVPLREEAERSSPRPNSRTDVGRFKVTPFRDGLYNLDPDPKLDSGESLQLQAEAKAIDGAKA